jgi:oxygen-independent coproporphyrinogen-3 oxidase
VWRDLGVRSLSLGTQSLVDAQLEYLGRSHTGAQAATAVSHARAAGFDIVSLDLIFGLEAQTPDYWRDEIRAVTQLQPEHVSCYQLTFHEGTPFARWLEQGRRSALPEEEQAELYLLLVDELAAAGYSAYEVSNFARRPEFESRHNSKYWGHIPYLGLGPSAHSFDGDRRRWWNARNLPDYLKALDAGARPIADQEVLADHELVTEAVMLGLRTRAGLDLQRVSRRWNVDLAAHNASRFARWREEGLVVGNELLRPTARGMAIADRLAADVHLGPTRSQ